MKNRHFWILFAAIPLFFSCAAHISGSLDADGSSDISVSVSLEPRMSSLIRRLSAAGNSAGNSAGSSADLVLNGRAIGASMSKAPGISSVMLHNTSSSSIEGKVQISSVNDFLGVQEGFIVFEQNTVNGGQKGYCMININLKNGPEIIRLLSPEIDDYLNALMAPIATGEELTKNEYLNIVASVYSKSISDEIASSRIRASMVFPGNISGVKGGTFSGRQAEFDIPLVDLLVLERPVNFEVEW